MLQFWRNHKFREVEINPEHHAFAQARWDAWIHSPEYEKIFRQYFREYDGQQLAGDHDFDDWNYQQFVRSAAYNQAIIRLLQDGCGAGSTTRRKKNASKFLKKWI